jgi:hypothetical protein
LDFPESELRQMMTTWKTVSKEEAVVLEGVYTAATHCPTEATRLMYEREDGERCGKWYAMIGDCYTTGCKHKESVTSDWVRRNFTRDFVDLCITKNGKYVAIPVGSSAGAVSDGDDGTPEVKYQQSRDPLGKNACVMYGLASALFFLGATDKDKKPIDAEIKNLDRLKYQGNIMKMVRVSLRKKSWNTRIIDKFDPLLDKSDTPTVMQIHSSSGSVSHAVTIVGDLIFDSNKTHAVRLDATGLDRVCLGSDTFRKAKSAFRLVPWKTKRRMSRLKRYSCANAKPPSKKHKACPDASHVV